MTLKDIRDRLDRREYSDPAGVDYVRSALLSLIDAAVADGHTPDLTTGCVICNALAELVAVDDIVNQTPPA